MIIQNLLLAISLSMDACAISMSNALVEKDMKIRKTIFISFMFGMFQSLMPLIGFLLGSVFKHFFISILPIISFALLSFIGGKMLYESNKKEESKVVSLTFKTIIIQTIATSIDAFSVGITFVEYTNKEAYMAFVLIGLITFILCIISNLIGKRIGDKLANKAGLIGGIILICIGIKILIEYLLTL